MSATSKTRLLKPTNGKAKPLRPAGCLGPECPDVAAIGDVRGMLADVLLALDALAGLPEQVAALDRHVGVLVQSVEGMKDGLCLLTQANASVVERVDKALTGGIHAA